MGACIISRNEVTARTWQQFGRTWSVGVLLLPFPTHTEEGVDMAEEDKGGWEDRLLMVGHNEVVTLVLPHQIRNGLHLQIHIAGKQRVQKWRWAWTCCVIDLETQLDLAVKCCALTWRRRWGGWPLVYTVQRGRLLVGEESATLLLHTGALHIAHCYWHTL